MGGSLGSLCFVISGPMALTSLLFWAVTRGQSHLLDLIVFSHSRVYTEKLNLDLCGKGEAIAYSKTFTECLLRTSSM